MKSEIVGVKIKKLNVHMDDRGYLYEILRNDDPQFKEFGQVYVSATLPGVVKGFHEHIHQTDNITCVKGRLKLVLIARGDPMGDLVEEYILVPGGLMITIPPGIMHGWKNIGTEEAVVINIPDQPYDHDNPDELRYPPHDHYDWETKDR